MSEHNKDTGYISIYRSIQTHWIWEDPVKLKWWITLLLEVNHKPNKVNISNQLYECKRGQTIKSLSSIAKLFGASKDAVRNFLVLLEKDGMIVRENLVKTTRITICNYDNYQLCLRVNQTLTHPNNNDNKEIILSNTLDSTTNSKDIKELGMEDDEKKISSSVISQSQDDIQKKPASKPKASKKNDFINELLDIFAEEYLSSKGREYQLNNPGKERKAIGMLLNHYKRKNADKNGKSPDSEQTKHQFRDFFQKCINIDDNWLSTHVSPTMINAKLNDYVAAANKKTDQKRKEDAGFDKVVDKFFDENGRLRPQWAAYSKN